MSTEERAVISFTDGYTYEDDYEELSPVLFHLGQFFWATVILAGFVLNFMVVLVLGAELALRLDLSQVSATPLTADQWLAVAFLSMGGIGVVLIGSEKLREYF